MTDPVPSKDQVSEVMAIPDAAVYHVCNYLMEGKCQRCAPRVDTPYGPGESGCFALAKEQIDVVLIALRTGQPMTDQLPSKGAAKDPVCKCDPKSWNGTPNAICGHCKPDPLAPQFCMNCEHDVECHEQQ